MARKRTERESPASPGQTPFQQMMKYMLGQGLAVLRTPSGNRIRQGQGSEMKDIKTITTTSWLLEETPFIKYLKAKGENDVLSNFLYLYIYMSSMLFIF